MLGTDIAGKENVVEIGDINVYNNHRDQSECSPELAEALKRGRAAIDGLGLSSDVAKSIVENYGKLTIELGKEKPSPDLLKLLWAPVSAFAKGVKPLLNVGKLIVSMFGVDLPLPESE